LQAINSAIANVEGELQKLDQEAREAEARRQARADALQEAQERREAEREEALQAVLAASRAKCCGLVKVIGADRITNNNSLFNVVTLIANVSGKNYKMSALCPIGVRDCRPLVENNIYMFEVLPKGNPDGYNLDNDMGSIRIFSVDGSGQRHGATVYAVATVN
jgi:hypothetical protein